MTAPTAANILYISYDGLTDPLGRSQILPYLAGLSALGHAITILSCEKPDRLASEGAKVARICADAGLRWEHVPYHKFPPVASTAFDAATITRAALRLDSKRHFDIVHCRSYIAAMSGLALKRKRGTKFLFDMRGFWPEEKVEGGNWPQSNPVFRAVYRYFKRREVEFLANADHVISLTEEGRRELTARPGGALAADRISVIPCCVDFDHFAQPDGEARRAARRTLGISGEAKVLVYLGSLGGNYMLDELLDFFLAYRERHAGAVFLFVTQDPAQPIRQAADAKGIAPGEIVIRGASREEVPAFVAAADIGVAFKQPVFSSKACSPTKLGEMLALGVPVVANSGVGDVVHILEDTSAGIAISAFDPRSYREAVDQVEALRLAPEEMRRRALAWFDVGIGIARYDAVYRRLTAQAGSARGGAEALPNAVARATPQ
jgi:glycosyltransferase involved in cell wall biosynthesis